MEPLMTQDDEAPVIRCDAPNRSGAVVFCVAHRRFAVIFCATLFAATVVLTRVASCISARPKPRQLVHPDLQAVVGLLDWDTSAKLPPWLSPIKEGASQGVAVVLGQSLKPDGSIPQVLIDRAEMAKQLLDEGKVVKVMVCGADPAGVGHTEAYEAAKVLKKAGIPPGSIIQEAQSTTTAENAWFALRWIPDGTGQLYLITSDFHMARAAYIFQETFNYFYKMVEDEYRDDPMWKNGRKRYPRLKIHQIPTKSFCGSDASLNEDSNTDADINTKSLALRAKSELTYLGDGEVPGAMYGAPRFKIMYIWPIQIDVNKDPMNRKNYQNAVAQAMHVAQSLCVCKAPPEKKGPALAYPLSLPISTDLPTHINDWQSVVNACPTL